MTEISERGMLILSLNRALGGEVTPNMRAVLVWRNEKDMEIRFVFYAEPSEDEIEGMGYIGTETVADFNNVTNIREFYEVIKTGDIRMRKGEILVYRRKD